MVDIKTYINDGANWQAQAVLAYLRAYATDAVHKTWNDFFHDYDASVIVGRYENCREQGYVFAINYKCQQRNYAVYEHRNSDKLCVLISNGVSLNTPSVDFMWKEHTDENGVSLKYDYDKDFSCGQIVECGEFIIEDMKQFIDDFYK